MKKQQSQLAASRRKNAIVIAICLAAIATFIYVNHRLTTASFRGKSRDILKYDRKIFNVINVVDGDTINLAESESISGKYYNYTKVRLWGVDTPETESSDNPAMYFGKEAAEFTSRLVLNKQVTVFLDADRKTRDKYQRLLAYIKLPDDRFLNELLLSEGYAYADRRFDHQYYDKYKQLEADARSSKKGLWQNATRSQLPQWLQEKEPQLLLNK